MISNTKTIEIESLAIGYFHKKGTKTVAQNINASIHEGELTCLLGANGIGKSTLLRTLSAFQPKLAGSIRIQGKKLEEYTHSELSHVIGVVLTDRLDVRNMTAEELIALGRSPYTHFWGTLSAHDKAIVKQSIEQIRIENLAHRMVETLSDGERQKVMIAKALAQETPIIFLDEPTAFLDFPSKVEIMQLLHTLSRSMRKTIFLSTHDLDLALQIADKLWIMDKTHGVMTGTPEDLSLNGTLSAVFAHKGITYHTETGTLEIEHKHTQRIKLSGEGERYYMARKALGRNGILAGPNIDSGISVEVKSQEYIIYIPQEQAIRASSIEELLGIVNCHYRRFS